MEQVMGVIESLRKVLRELKMIKRSSSIDNEVLYQLRIFLHFGMYIDQRKIYWELKKYEAISEGGGNRLREIWLENIHELEITLNDYFKEFLPTDNENILDSIYKILRSDYKVKYKNEKDVIELKDLVYSFYGQLLELKSFIVGDNLRISELGPIEDDYTIHHSDLYLRFNKAVELYLLYLKPYFDSEDFLAVLDSFKEFLIKGCIDKNNVRLIKPLNKKVLGYRLSSTYRYFTSNKLSVDYAKWVKSTFECFKDNTVGDKNGEGNIWGFLRENIEGQNK